MSRKASIESRPLNRRGLVQRYYGTYLIHLPVLCTMSNCLHYDRSTAARGAVMVRAGAAQAPHRTGGFTL